MKKKTLVIGGVTLAATLAGGWALAQSVGPPSGFGAFSMHGQAPGGMGHGKMKGMGGHRPGMMRGMDHGTGHGPGMMKGMSGHGPGMMKDPGIMHGGQGAAFADPTQLEPLKAELGITATQETAWNTYAKALQDATSAMSTARESVDPGTVSKMTPSERFAFVSGMREQAQKRFEAVGTAANELLGVLDDAQKAKARDTLPGLAFGPGRWGPFASDQSHKH
ncbi:MAG TPA: Spy/CpxP family protein refolding chaperone [Hyphomicrobiaceae bacterium]|nr:Spy/CpxP family protein refolding chaperone [Hyphomicrobiaceae bacterium]